MITAANQALHYLRMLLSGATNQGLHTGLTNQRESKQHSTDNAIRESVTCKSAGIIKEIMQVQYHSLHHSTATRWFKYITIF